MAVHRAIPALWSRMRLSKAPSVKRLFRLGLFAGWTGCSVPASNDPFWLKADFLKSVCFWLLADSFALTTYSNIQTVKAPLKSRTKLRSPPLDTSSPPPTILSWLIYLSCWLKTLPGKSGQYKPAVFFTSPRANPNWNVEGTRACITNHSPSNFFPQR